MILLDWTRMGKTYCIAGVVCEGGRYRVVRPLLAKHRAAPVRNTGWTPWQLDGHTRWEIFELIGPQAAEPQPPHLEDIWVHSLRPRRCLASAEQRRAVLDATCVQSDHSLFGAALTVTRTAAWLESGTGHRSLATVVVPRAEMRFTAAKRAGAVETDFRVVLPVPGAEERSVPVKDHHLLRRIEGVATTPDGQLQRLREVVGEMGDRVAVRLGLTRSFQAADGGAAVCWLMADGFFSLTEPQP